MSNLPAKTIWEAARQFKFDQPLREDDERFVETARARGNFTYRSLLRPLSVDIATEPWTLKGEPEQVYALFCGHRGCGKSTELRRLERRLHAPALFFVVFLDALEELDINNLQYSDILMALAKRLFERLQEHDVQVEAVYLRRMEDWFRERAGALQILLKRDAFPKPVRAELNGFFVG